MNMQGKTVLITGGNSGIGKETAVGLAKAGANVVFTSRDDAKGAAAAADVSTRAGREVAWLPLDLASFASIRRFADDVLSRYDRLDVIQDAWTTLAACIICFRLLHHDDTSAG